jgi:hypothetical protein
LGDVCGGSDLRCSSPALAYIPSVIVQDHSVRKRPSSPHSQFVKRYVTSSTNDASDAEAIGEAVARPNIRFASHKSIAQKDLECLHRVRGPLGAAGPSYIPTLSGRSIFLKIFPQ